MDDSKSVFSDLTFTVVSSPDRVKYHSVLDNISIPEDPTIKGIFAAAGNWMQVSAAATPSDIDKITIEILKYQVTMLAKNGATLIDQVVNSYSMNTLTLSNCMFNEDVVSGSLNNKVNGEINPPYLFNTITSCNNEEVHLGIFSASPMSSREQKNKYDNNDTSNSRVVPSPDEKNL